MRREALRSTGPSGGFRGARRPRGLPPPPAPPHPSDPGQGRRPRGRSRGGPERAGEGSGCRGGVKVGVGLSGVPGRERATARPRRGGTGAKGGGSACSSGSTGSVRGATPARARPSALTHRPHSSLTRQGAAVRRARGQRERPASPVPPPILGGPASLVPAHSPGPPILERDISQARHRPRLPSLRLSPK